MEGRTKCATERDAVASRTAFSEATAAHVSIAKWLRASVASSGAEMREGSELDRDASAGIAMGRAAQQRIVPVGHDTSAQMRVREGHTAA
jgi:hypothetical protein